MAKSTYCGRVFPADPELWYQQQVPLLEPGGVLAQNLKAVQQVQVELGLMKPGAPLPRVDDAPLRQALNQP